jgi:hypothetical protein
MINISDIKSKGIRWLLPFFLCALLISCSSRTVKEKINDAGDMAGQAAGEFAKGVGNGVTKAFEVDIHVSPVLGQKGIKQGKNTVSSDTTGTDNLLNAYLIFDKDFSGKITAKVVDGKSQEMGRTSTMVEGKAGDARFVDFHFDPRTNIDSDSRITIE